MMLFSLLAKVSRPQLLLLYKLSGLPSRAAESQGFGHFGSQGFAYF